MPHLHILDQSCVAEAAFYVGVAANRRNDAGEALRWMERALALNPHHKDTQNQVELLRRVIGGRFGA